MNANDTLNLDSLLQDLQDVTAPTPLKPNGFTRNTVNTSSFDTNRANIGNSNTMQHLPHPPRENKSPSLVSAISIIIIRS
jgi:hypothetical protein